MIQSVMFLRDQFEQYENVQSLTEMSKIVNRAGLDLGGGGSSWDSVSNMVSCQHQLAIPTDVK